MWTLEYLDCDLNHTIREWNGISPVIAAKKITRDYPNAIKVYCDETCIILKQNEVMIALMLSI